MAEKRIKSLTRATALIIWCWFGCFFFFLNGTPFRETRAHGNILKIARCTEYNWTNERGDEVKFPYFALKKKHYFLIKDMEVGKLYIIYYRKNETIRRPECAVQLCALISDTIIVDFVLIELWRI